ncbi:MAG: hypothetical protein KA419_04705 [Acidobacteria bacterium]|nr:hypothetical protein [Acidobacteriota bacterium]
MVLALLGVVSAGETSGGKTASKKSAPRSGASGRASAKGKPAPGAPSSRREAVYTSASGPSVPDADVPSGELPFEGADNVIGNPEGLYRFFRKLDALRNGRRLKVNVLHVGDSHIQADFMTATTRRLLQGQFGNAGRGLVFPYDLVRTNGPVDYASSSNVAWCSDRNIARAPTLPTGISGMVLQSDEPNAYIRMFLKNTDEMNYDFNQVTVLYEKGELFCDLVFFDADNRQIGYISALEEMYSDSRFSTSITFPFSISNFTLYTYAAQETQKLSRLYGMLLENGQSGIRYDTVGVNGAEFRHYAGTPYFFQQTASLSPDLVIVSLGTNDSMVKSFSTEDFVNAMDSMVMQIKQMVPDASILLTVPPDSLKRSRVNYNLESIRRIIINYCRENNFAYWDLLSVMGGLTSIRQWQSQGLAQRDNVHYTRTGYHTQGKLLYEALMKGYDQYAVR